MVRSTPAPVPSFNPYDAQLWLCDELSPASVHAYRETSPAPAPVAARSHGFYEVLYFRSCGGTRYLVGQSLYSPQPGDVLLIPPGVSHCAVLPEVMSEPFARDVLRFTQPFFYEKTRLDPGSLLPVSGDTFLFSVSGCRWELISLLFEVCVWEDETRQLYWEQSIQAAAAHLLCLLLRLRTQQDPSPLSWEKSPLLLQVIDYIDKNLAEKITLESTAEYFSTSRSTLSQTFRKKTGIGFYTFVIQRRLLAAKSLISQGLPLEQVGKSVGFAEYSAFYRAFRQKFGISPREYRDRCAKSK